MDAHLSAQVQHCWLFPRSHFLPGAWLWTLPHPGLNWPGGLFSHVRLQAKVPGEVNQAQCLPGLEGGAEMSQLLCGAGGYPGAQALPLQIKELRIVHKVGQFSLEFIFLTFPHRSLIPAAIRSAHASLDTTVLTFSTVQSSPSCTSLTKSRNGWWDPTRSSTATCITQSDLSACSTAAVTRKTC